MNNLSPKLFVAKRLHLALALGAGVTMNLVQCQQLMEEQLGKEAMTFIRLGKQLIVNRAYIFKINVNKQQLIMSNTEVNNAFTLQASKEALKQLKNLIELEREGKL